MKDKQGDPLSPVEHEYLSILIEEMGEALHIAGKVLRHGWNPRYKGIWYYNQQDLQKELGDVLAAIIRLCEAKILSEQVIHKRAAEKLKPGGTLLFK